MNTISSTSFLRARQWSRACCQRGFSVALSACLLLSSMMLAYTLLAPCKNAYAAGPVEFATEPNPWGVALDAQGHIFVAEPGCDVPICPSTFPATISEYNVANGSKVTTFTEPAGYSSPAFLVVDSFGNVWYSGGFAGVIGRFSSGTSTNTVFDVSLDACPVGSPPSCGVHISGVAVDSQGRVWFDDLLSDRIGYLNPTTTQFTAIKLTGGAHPHDGLLVAANDNVWFTEEYVYKLGEIAGGVLPVVPTPTPTVTTSVGGCGTPVSCDTFGKQRYQHCCKER